MRLKNPWQDDAEDEFSPLSAEEARQWRSQQLALPAWQLVALQLIVGSAAAVVVGLVWQSAVLALSVAYGALAVVVPNAVLWRGIAGVQGRLSSEAVVLRFFVWELVKIGLSIAILGGAGRILGDLSWPALLTGLVLTMKVNWFLLAYKPRKNGLPDGKD